MPCLPATQARVLLSGERASRLVLAPLAMEAQRPRRSDGQGVVSCLSEAFPEPAAPSYGAPGVEFMGLHRENNAVVQVCFLPGQVRPRCALPLTDGRTWDHHAFPAVALRRS